jgi:predicted GNAT superfamily acetyltransferase
MAGGQGVIEIRPLRERAQLEQAVELQKRIWGFADVDVLPLRFFVVAGKVGGHCFGAYDRELMIGFLLGIPGLKPGGKPFFHSHMMGLLPEYRSQGLGRQLKLRQREEALVNGIDLVEWTFDPLLIRNAYFNIERLGVIVHAYSRNLYGTTPSLLQGSLPTDRCIAEWRIRSPRVEAILAGAPLPREVTARIEVPLEIERMRREDPERAREIQRANAERFECLFRQGLAVVGFERTEAAGVYLLGPAI